MNDIENSDYKFNHGKTGIKDLDSLIDWQRSILDRLYNPKPFSGPELESWKKSALDACIGQGETNINFVLYRPLSDKLIIQKDTDPGRKLATLIIGDYLTERFEKANKYRYEAERMQSNDTE